MTAAFLTGNDHRLGKCHIVAYLPRTLADLTAAL